MIDWGFPGAGAAWVDAAFLALRLVEAGQHPDDAEDWARSLTCWSGVDRETLTAFAVYVAGMWSYWTVTDNSRGAGHRARLARDYAAWRLASLHSMTVPWAADVDSCSGRTRLRARSLRKH